MSVFTKNALIERLEDEVETLKSKNDEIASRLLNMTKQMTKNRVAAKSVVEERDAEIASLKEQLRDASNVYVALKDYHDHSLEERDEKMASLSSEYTSLKESFTSISSEYAAFKNYHDHSLEEQHAYTEQLASQAADNETMLALKNAQTTLQLEMAVEEVSTLKKELTEKETDLVKRNDTVCSLYSKLLATENELAQAKGQISQMIEMINAFRNASSYMNEVLSRSA